MKISIITVVYNGEKTIEKTIKSVVREKEHNNDIEYIIIDLTTRRDCSLLVNFYPHFNT